MDSYNSVLVQTATEHVISEHIEHVHNTVKYAYIYIRMNNIHDNGNA